MSTLSTTSISLIFLFLNTFAAHAASLGAADFKPSLDHPFGFRGDGSGRFPDATPVTDWSVKEKKNVRWAAEVGVSFSSPILTDKSVFVTSEPNLLICVDRASGTPRWKAEIKPSDLPDEKSQKAAAAYEPPKDGSGMIAATPLTDGTRVYAVLANGIVRAIDLDGKGIWASYIDAEQITGYGRSSSPIMTAGKLIVHMTNLYAFDPATGKQLWMNTEAPSTYGTPCAAKVGDVDCIVTPDGQLVRASDGKTLATEIGHAVHTSPVAENGVVYFGENTLNATKLATAGKCEELWSGQIRTELFGSPVLHDGLLFTINAKGELFVFNQKAKGDQEPLVDARPLLGDAEGNAANTYSSLALGGKYFFLNSLRGDVIVFEANREAKIVAKNTVSSGSGSSPVFSGSDMFIRDGNKLLCIGK